MAEEKPKTQRTVWKRVIMMTTYPEWNARKSITERTIPLHAEESSPSSWCLGEENVLEEKVLSRGYMSMQELPYPELAEDDFVISRQFRRASSASPLMFSRDTAPCAPRRRYSKSSNQGSEAEEDSDIDDEAPDIPIPELRCSTMASTSGTSCSNFTDSSEDVSLTDAQIEYIVKANIPPHVMKQMSKGIWEKLFTVDAEKCSQGNEEAARYSDIMDDLTMDSEEGFLAPVSPAKYQQPAITAEKEKPSNDSPKKRLSVVFCDVRQVRQYERILVVHPSTSSGPSLGIGWSYVEDTAPMDWFKTDGCSRRGFLLSRSVREIMVDELGYSSRDIAKAVRQNLKIKASRRRTINNLPDYGSFALVEKVEYMIEKVQRRIGRLKVGRRTNDRI
jgi:hypothetical protein